MEIYPADLSAKNPNNESPTTIITIKIKHGIAPWRGIIDSGLELADFFFILCEPMLADAATS